MNLNPGSCRFAIFIFQVSVYSLQAGTVQLVYQIKPCLLSDQGARSPEILLLLRANTVIQWYIKYIQLSLRSAFTYPFLWNKSMAN
jgi:hypothetical protein